MALSAVASTTSLAKSSSFPLQGMNPVVGVRKPFSIVAHAERRLKRGTGATPWRSGSVGKVIGQRFLELRLPISASANFIEWDPRKKQPTPELGVG
jgi:hypothetical protein